MQTAKSSEGYIGGNNLVFHTFPLKKKPTSLAVAFREEFSQV